MPHGSNRNGRIPWDRVAVVIPTYDERENIGVLTRRLFASYPGISVFVVDDDSPDGTSHLVRELQGCCPNLFLIERRSNRGFARAYIEGLRAALDGGFDAVFMMDADLSHQPEELERLRRSLDDHHVVIGSRYVKGGKVQGWSPARHRLSRFANRYVKLVLSRSIQDWTAGFMGLRTEVLKDVPLVQIRSDGYAFLVEFKHSLMTVSGTSIAEEPITFQERREGESKMSLAVMWESVWVPWRLRWRSRRNR